MNLRFAVKAMAASNAQVWQPVMQNVLQINVPAGTPDNGGHLGFSTGSGYAWSVMYMIIDKDQLPQTSISATVVQGWPEHSFRATNLT